MFVPALLLGKSVPSLVARPNHPPEISQDTYQYDSSKYLQRQILGKHQDEPKDRDNDPKTNSCEHGVSPLKSHAGVAVR